MTELLLALENTAALNARLFNQLYPVGTPVRYWRGVRRGPGIASRTRSEAWANSGASLVSVEGCAGGIALTHIEVIES